MPLDALIMAEPLAGSIVTLLVGLLLLYMGRRLVLLLLVIAGALVGYYYGGALLASITSDPTLIRFGPLVLALLLALCAGFLLKLSFFAAGLLAGWVLVSASLPGVHVLIRIVLALLTGFMMSAFRKPLIATVTSLMGGRLAALGIVSVIALLGVSVPAWAFTVGWVLLSVSGIAFQISGSKKGR